ncbi:unnamed protein product [Knipowitschia caucasica]
MNGTYNISPHVILLSYNLPPASIIPAFIFASLGYAIILFCNLILIFTIILNKSLHQPLYLILINLPINDLIGSSAFFIQALKQIAWKSQTVSYTACVTQAFFIHIYACGATFIITSMAYDRYVAICWPLRYNVVMTNVTVIKIILCMWLGSFVLMSILIGLLLRLPQCKTDVFQPYCDNPSLLELVCGNKAINNIYGLLTVAASQVLSNGMVLFTYLRILISCFRSKHSDTKAKALQTCATHLLVFLLLESLGLFTIISYRIRNMSPRLRRFIGVSTLIFPPTLNPIIYGLKTKEIRVKVTQFFMNSISKIR